MDVELRVAASAAEAQREAAELLAEAARRGGHIALSGGSTPRPAYESAARLAPDWSGVEVWWADERCVPPDDERSNYRLVRESLLDRLDRRPCDRAPRPRRALPGEGSGRIRRASSGSVVFDLALLGIGPDGHTASLFPNDPALDELGRRAAAVPRPDVDRVTATIPQLNASEIVVFLIIGEEKADAVARSFAGAARRRNPRGTRPIGLRDDDRAPRPRSRSSSA